MILADTSIWIDFFRRRMPQMRSLLDLEKILIHPFVKTELALGSLADRKQTLLDLDLLDRIPIAADVEVRQLIEAHSLYSRGIGFVDAHLIASCLLTSGTQLWTRDTRLAAAASHAGVRVKQTSN